MSDVWAAHLSHLIHPTSAKIHLCYLYQTYTMGILRNLAIFGGSSYYDSMAYGILPIYQDIFGYVNNLHECSGEEAKYLANTTIGRPFKRYNPSKMIHKFYIIKHGYP